MSFVSSLVSSFCFLYLLDFILRIFNLSYKPKIRLIILLIVFCLMSVDNIILLFNAFSFYYLLSLLGNITGFIAIYILFFNCIITFKSRRSRKFMRAINRKEELMKAKYVQIFLYIIGFLLIIYGLFSISSIKGITILVCGILIIFLPLVFKNKKNILFLLQINDTKYLYKKEITNNESINDYLGDLKDNYILDDFGFIIDNKITYHCYFLQIKEDTNNYLQTITLDRYDEPLIIDAYKEFSKLKQKKIILDENKKIVKIVEIK